MSGIELGFPIWGRAFHRFDLLFMSLLIRNGTVILVGDTNLYQDQD